MSFALTTEQILNRTKTVTRRLGWKDLKEGQLIRACKKCMGFKKGEKIEPLAVLRVTKVRRERLEMIVCEPGGARKEGFPGMRRSEFVRMFCENMNCKPEDEVTRIEFEYVETCSSCETTENVTFGPDPFSAEIHDDETPCWMCGNCRHESAMDI